MHLREDIPLAPLTTFRLGPSARYLIDIRTKEELPEAFAFIREKRLPFFVLGGGSNIIFTDLHHFEGIVLRVEIPGFEVSGTTVRVGAGEDWDSVVEQCVSQGLSGIEAMSAIPGSAGATPIQNVGAYGREIADVLESVEVHDYLDNLLKTLSPEECRFTYRDSIFRHEKRYVITAITLKLSEEKSSVPDYPGVKAFFGARGITDPSLADIRSAIIEIRKTKLPDPKDVPSVGSFFKNPFVSEEVVLRLQEKYDAPIVFEQNDGKYKVGAGWLIDTLGLKGKSFGTISTYPQNALVLTNTGGATYAELAEVMTSIQKQVHERFGIDLEPEPTFI